MAHKERNMMAARMRNIFPDKIKKERRGRPRKIFKASEVVFDNSVKKDEGKIEKERTPEEKYFYLSSLGDIADKVESGIPLNAIKSDMRKAGKDGIEKLTNAGIIEIKDGKVEINREKFRDLFKKSDAAMVLYIYKEYPGITIEDAAGKLPFTEAVIGKERVKLVKAGFLEKKKPQETEGFYLTEYSKGLGIETWGLDEKLEKLRREKEARRRVSD